MATHLTYVPPRWADEYSFSGRGRRRYVIVPPDRPGVAPPRDIFPKIGAPPEPGEPRG